LQRHIGEAYGKKVEVRNSRRTIMDENKFRNKASNIIRLTNGKEIRTENIAEINSNVIKAEMCAVHIRSVLEHYKLFNRTFYVIPENVNEELEEIVWENVNVVKRDRANLAENISRNVIALEEKGITNDTLKRLRACADNYIEMNTPPDVITEKEEEELIELAERTIEVPYKEWMQKEKTKIRYNFAGDAKRTWNRIKQTCGQATKIKPEVFKEHYEKNWPNAPKEINVEENSRFVLQRKLVMKESEMVSFLQNKNGMMKAIARKGNLSALGINKLTYPILKFEKEDAADLMIKIMTMMIRVQKCPESWKEGKVVMLPKPCDESEKDKPGNWRPITLTSIMYRIIFGKIA
jgi:hypothetical protein